MCIWDAEKCCVLQLSCVNVFETNSSPFHEVTNVLHQQKHSQPWIRTHTVSITTFQQNKYAIMPSVNWRMQQPNNAFKRHPTYQTQTLMFTSSETRGDWERVHNPDINVGEVTPSTEAPYWMKRNSGQHRFGDLMTRLSNVKFGAMSTKCQLCGWHWRGFGGGG